MDKLKKLFKKDDSSSSSHSHQRTSTSETSQAPPPQRSHQQTEYASGGAQAGDQYSQGQVQPQGQVQSQGQPQGQTQGQPQAQGVLLTTTLGNITIVMFNDKTPRTCQNFVGLADAGRYDGVIFHRIIPNFMIQGGDPTGTGRGGESIFGGKFEDEFHPELTHTGKGILSMANSGPGTNGSQFFITLTATPHLNGKHTVFGKVVDGMDVVDRLGAVQRDSGDRPLQEVAIIKAESFTV